MLLRQRCRYDGHPKTFYLREKTILDAVIRFYDDRLFGPGRRALITADLTGIDDRAARERQAERERHQRALADIARRQDALVRQAENGEPNDPFTRALRTKYNDLDNQRTAITAELDQLDAADRAEPARPTAAQADLLDEVPRLRRTIADAPEKLLRRLFEITQLTVRLPNNANDEITITVHLPGDYLGDIAAIAIALEEPQANGDIYTKTRTNDGAGSHVDAVRAPGRTRTCDLEIRI